MRVIIACAGPQVKWGSYLGVPSHFAPVRVSEDSEEREPLIARTLRQVAKHVTSEEVVLTCPEGDGRYWLGGVTSYGVTGRSEFDSTRQFWSKDERTVLLLGDVYFSDLAIRKILTPTTGHVYKAFGRFGASNVTGTPYGELFAHSWWPEQIPEVDGHLAHVEQARAQGIMRPHGWMLLRSFQGGALNRHIVKSEFFTQIHDWTDDIDYPEDFDRHPATRGYRW